MSRRALIASALCAGLGAAGCCRQPARSGIVDPGDHDAFFLWAGVRAPDVLRRARTVYLLAGEVRHDDPDRFVPLRATPRIGHARIWLVVRVERLDWGEGVWQAVWATLSHWRAAGNRLAGLQLDFDAATRGLGGYAVFLRQVRERLPPDLGLSVTGLLDWSAGGDPEALLRLAGVVDEVVIQTYQGRHTIPGYEAYLRSLSRLRMPYRIALVEGGDWQEPSGLADDPDFRGYVVFLLGQ